MAAKKAVVYKQGVVTFLDLLGFKQLLVEKSAEELAEVLATFRTEGNPNYETGIRGVDKEWASMFEYAVLSDCMFRCVDIHCEANISRPIGHFYNELMAIMFVQTRLAWDGYLIRGAMTYGDFFATRDKHGQSLFGPSISRAYEMETKLANYPRVVIDPRLIKEYFSNLYLKNEIHTAAYEWVNFVRPILRRDEGSVWYLDYLFAYVRMVGEAPSIVAMFDHHKKLVETNIGKLPSSEKKYPDSVTDKILWLFRYHNVTMNRFTKSDWRDFGVKKADFFIATPDHPAFADYEDVQEDD